MGQTKNIVKGGLYEANSQNIATDMARVVDINDGIVSYEHVSRVKVILYTTIDEFSESWRLKI